MMKLVLSSIFLLVLVMTAALFLDHLNEQKVYSFCTQYSIGNDIKVIHQEAEKSKQILIKLDENTEFFEILLYSPFSNSIGCEIKHVDGKVTDLSYIKQ